MSKPEKTAKSPFANLTDADLKIVGKMADATRKAEKASEALNRAMADAYNAGLHTKSGWSNFGKWAEAAMAAKGVRIGKSSAYKAVKIAEVRNMAPAANDLPDTVVAKIAETAPMGDPEKVSAFVAEVIESGGTVETVKGMAGGTGESDRDPADVLAETFAERIVKLVRGDVKRAEAILSYAGSIVKEKMIAATK